MVAAPREVDLGADEVASLVHAAYGIDPVTVSLLPSELSTVARLDLDSGVLVAKVTGCTPAELRLTEWRVEAVEHLADRGLPVARSVRDANGRRVTVADARCGAVVLHLSEWLPGMPLEAADPTPALLRGVGATAAGIAQALAAWLPPPVPVAHAWELVRTQDTLDAALGSVADASLRSLVEEAADRFRRHVAPVLGSLPRSVVHHDLHDSNLLVDPATGRVTGVLDFGDMVVGPRVAELAVAAGYACRGAADPVDAFLHVAEGWGRGLPLTAPEVGVVLDAAVGRLAVNAAVWASREDGRRGAYARARSARSEHALVALLGADRESMLAGLRARLGSEPTPA